MSENENSFRDEIARVMRSGPPSTASHLLGMEMDFDAYLSDLDALDAGSVSVWRTERPDTLIRADCVAAPGISVEQAAEAVSRVWQAHLRYQFHEAHHLSVAGGDRVFRFVTQIGPGTLYVTGQVTIRPSARTS